jgi:starch synthase
MITVLSVASEIYPLIKTGGLADVAGALPGALAPLEIDMHSLVPGYPAVLEKLGQASIAREEPLFFGGSARILAAQSHGLKLFVLDAPHLFARPGNPYCAPDGGDWPDNPQRFAALSYAAFLLAQGNVAGFMPDIVHAHDWQAALAPAYLHYAGAPRPASVITVHNLAFQGLASASLLGELRLPADAYAWDGVEFFGNISALKAGLQFADRITTVSPTYAAEICTPMGGMGLEGLLNHRAGQLIGIVNGIDTAIWDPSNDAALPAAFSASAMTGKRASKAALQTRFGLDPDPSALLFGLVSRLSHQKGLDVLLDALDQLLSCGAQLALLGSGDAELQNGFLAAAASHPGRVGGTLGYDETIAHLIQAGSDAVLVPSRFEPCGLTQLCAMRYGALPVVSRVGGLADTVIDANAAARTAKVATGFVFSPVNASALRKTIARVAEMWALPEEWALMQANAMRQDVGWNAPATVYARLYGELLEG